MEIQFIYTFNNTPQEIVEHPFIKQIAQDKETLIEFATTMLSKDKLQDLLKISCCVYLQGQYWDEPEWFEKWNGKLWFTDGKINNNQ